MEADDGVADNGTNKAQDVVGKDSVAADIGKGIGNDDANQGGWV